MSKAYWKYWFRRWKRCLVDGYLLQGYRSSLPDTLIIETTNRCTLGCSCCPNGVRGVRLRERGVMTRETFDRVLQNLDVSFRLCFLHMCGEPFLNEDLVYFSEQLLARKIIPVIYSNGYRINEELLRRLIAVRGVQISFSMDLISKKHYEQLRTPACFEEAKSSLQRINEIFLETKRHFGLNMIVDLAHPEQLENCCDELFACYSQLNSISLSVAWPWPALPETGDLGGNLVSKSDVCNQARGMLSVLWNGEVSFCNFDYSGDMIVGSILDTSYRTLYNAPLTRSLRRQLFINHKADNPLCEMCVLGRFKSRTVQLYRTKFNHATPEQRQRLFSKFQYSNG